MIAHNKLARTILIGAAAATLSLLTSAAQAQLIPNGSFELSPPIAPGWQTSGQASISSSGSNLATDGQYVGVIGVGGPFDAASGSVFQDLIFGEAGTFHYGFDAGTVFGGGFGFPVTFVFRIGDTVITNELPTYVSDSVSFSYYPLSTRIEGNIALAAGTHRIAFDVSRDFTLFGRGVAFVIDDFETSFAPTAIAAVPEPSSWALLLLGFGGVGVALRRQRRSAVQVA